MEAAEREVQPLFVTNPGRFLDFYWCLIGGRIYTLAYASGGFHLFFNGPCRACNLSFVLVVDMGLDARSCKCEVCAYRYRSNGKQIDSQPSFATERALLLHAFEPPSSEFLLFLQTLLCNPTCSPTPIFLSTPSTGTVVRILQHPSRSSRPLPEETWRLPVAPIAICPQAD